MKNKIHDNDDAVQCREKENKKKHTKIEKKKCFTYISIYRMSVPYCVIFRFVSVRRQQR